MKDSYFNLKNLAGLLIYACAFVSASTQAVTLNPGETVPLFGTTAVLSPETAGAIIDEKIANFAIQIDGNMVTGAVAPAPVNEHPFKEPAPASSAGG